LYDDDVGAFIGIRREIGDGPVPVTNGVVKLPVASLNCAVKILSALKPLELAEYIKLIAAPEQKGPIGLLTDIV
jgi:hypothetical protein